MFRLTIKYLGFLKFVPGMALLFDAWLKVYSLFTNPDMLDWIDEMEKEVLRWKDTSTQTHKYGGLQFNWNGRELGHIHSNGLLDMPLSRKVKAQLMREGRIQDHHSFKDTGWISFYMHTNNDTVYGLMLLKLAYNLRKDKHFIVAA
jgi:hypothetical protein